MVYNDELVRWIRKNNGYEYYLMPRFMELFWDCKLIYTDGNEVVIIYNGYIILRMVIQHRSINLLLYNTSRSGNLETSIQNKLFHEYNSHFEFASGYLKITQYNMYTLIRYVDSVKRKIEAGFEKYSTLLEKNITFESSSYLEIGINNAFSLEEFMELIDAYNQLYSLFYYACENGIEEVRQENVKQVLHRHNMVLESIHIGSEGALVAVGAEIIVEIVKAFLKSAFELNRSEAEKRKEELKRIAELDEYMATRERIFELIDKLDTYLEKRERGYKHGMGIYVENEIDTIIRKIEELQGTKHIDIAI